MKEWWNNLILREKQMVSLGALVVTLVIAYLLVWSPLDTKVTSLRNQIRHNQELLNWMREADKQIQTLQKSGEIKPATRGTGSLLSIIQNQINRTQLVSVMTQLHQIDNDSVQLAFQKVDFDKIIVWLTQLTQQQGLIITQMTITPSPAPGIVEAEFVLKGGNK